MRRGIVRYTEERKGRLTEVMKPSASQTGADSSRKEGGWQCLLEEMAPRLRKRGPIQPQQQLFVTDSGKRWLPAELKLASVSD